MKLPKTAKIYELFFFFYNCIVPMRFLPCEIRVAFLGESQLRQSRATQPTVHAGCFIVSIIHQTLTWTTGSLTCAQMLMHAIAHGGYGHCKRVCTEVDSGRKIPCRTGESNLRRRRAASMLYQLSLFPSIIYFGPNETAKKTAEMEKSSIGKV